MPNQVWIYFELLFVGSASFLVAFGIQKWKSICRRVAPPRPGTLFRISNGAGVSRTRLASVNNDLLRFDPPLSGSGLNCLELGGLVAAEYTSSAGLIRFRSKIVRVEDTGHFTAKIPPHTQVVDRRSDRRERASGGVTIEARESSWIDLSPLGGRFETDYPAKKGERIRLDFPDVREPIFGWVLELYPNQIRVRFEQRFNHLK